ncbi:DUF4241 domain-containing protein [Cellulomonas sp. NPDC057328]|uniref:DUF4241 domain-containing protein n=1 Tax=Cellulomonas sp. NPDC057328 TaxID=3346101 RepID=UPI0036276AFE
MTRRLLLPAALAAVALTSGCAGTPGGDGATYAITATVDYSDLEPQTVPEPVDAGAPVADQYRDTSAPRPTFTPCGRRPADPARTNLRPRTLTAADAVVALDRYGTIPVDGPLTVEAGGYLVLVDGTIDAGNGYEAAYGLTIEPDVAVAAGTVTAPVSLSVLDSEESGRRVAFVEVRVAAADPVTWEESPDLVFGTDGGDGGFLATGALPEGVEVDGWDYVEAFFPEGDESSNVCVERRTTPDGPMDGILFSIGWGDGGYPVYLGRAADGSVVSVVCWSGITPWEWSGLPGTPPEDA